MLSASFEPHSPMDDDRIGKWNSTNRWTVPVGGGVGRIVHFGNLPVTSYAQFFRNVERPDGPTSWSAGFQMQFLFPKK